LAIPDAQRVFAGFVGKAAPMDMRSAALVAQPDTKEVQAKNRAKSNSLARIFS